MFKGVSILIVGFALALWGHSLSHDDQFHLGLKKLGQLQLRSAAGSLSLSGSETLLTLGEKFEFQWAFGELKAAGKQHSGAEFSVKRPMDWQIRLPIYVIAIAAAAWAFIGARLLRASS